MITKELLESFCSKELIRKPICKPFNENGYTYATNGHIAIRVDLIDEYSENTLSTSMEKLATFKLYPDNQYVDIPDFVIGKPKTCPACNGSGLSSICPECDGEGEVGWTSDRGYDYNAECMMCMGKPEQSSDVCDVCDGKMVVNDETPIDINGLLFEWHTLKKLLELPGIKISTENSEYLKPVPFRFDGGVGIVMQMRRSEPINGEY